MNSNEAYFDKKFHNLFVQYLETANYFLDFLDLRDYFVYNVKRIVGNERNSNTTKLVTLIVRILNNTKELSFQPGF